MVLRTFLFGVLALLACAPARAEFNFSYNQDAGRWDLSNGVIHAAFHFSADGAFTFQRIDDLVNGGVWEAPDGIPSSPIRVRAGSATYDANTAYRLIEQHVETPDAKTRRQAITLQDLQGAVQIRIELDLYAGQPVLHHHIWVTNLTPRSASVRLADMAPYSFAAGANQTFELMRVTQWAILPRPADFQTNQIALNPDGTEISSLTGSHGRYCAWLALRDQTNRGLFAGWEFDGRAAATARHRRDDGSLQLSATVAQLDHPPAPGETFEVPAAFIGLFQGTWDDAGYSTHRFAESALATPAPAGFPYVAWDSWGYGEALDEQTLRQNADAAASLGIELFVVDLGWARRIGDWYEDPQKFPSGLRALSDYVHSRGMKFGLHFALAEADPNSPVLQANPDWTSSETDDYYGAVSLCLSNKPAQDWLIGETVRMIDDYNVDWILQDGENMVKQCTKTTHTHAPHDSNYSNSVNGIDAVVEAVRAMRPNVLWENCENGGNMMTFNMVKHYVTSITSDAGGALSSRRGVFGATYPFPPRFADRYMIEDPSSTYITRSYMFGGPWYFMNQLPNLPAEDAALAEKEVRIYKRTRAHVRRGQVFHLTAPPASGRIDALESYDPSDDTAIAIVTREGGDADHASIKLRGLTGTTTYRVYFQDDPAVLSMTGDQLSQDGALVNLPAPQTAEIVYAEPLNPDLEPIFRRY
jgi:alpha-galactosidase